MRILNNIPALLTQDALGTAENELQKSIRRLSSGLRINSSADDAAGLGISEKMRAQIKGLDQANRNAQDGISMIQTAEGGLNESHSILQRMRELSVQAANDTLTSEDRAYIQEEIDQLTRELDNIAQNTQFNRRKLLNGSADALWSSDKLSTKAIVRGSLDGMEGNFKIDVSVVDTGKAQVLKSNILTQRPPEPEPPYPYIWVPTQAGVGPLSNSISKVDIMTGREVGRYFTGPTNDGTDENPSRLVVDRNGDAWIANRGTNTIVKVGLSERGEGHYVDRNGNGIWDNTAVDVNGNGSIDLGEMMPWTVGGGPQDESILLEVELPPGATGNRGIVVDKDNNIWVLGWTGPGQGHAFHINGRTGTIMQTVALSEAGHNSYGAVMDSFGNIWSVQAYIGVLRFNPVTGDCTTMPVGGAYAITASGDGSIYVSSGGGAASTVTKFDASASTDGNLVQTWVSDPVSMVNLIHGLTVGPEGEIWGCDASLSPAADKIVRFNKDTGAVEVTIHTGQGGSGVTIDANGKLWAVNLDGTLQRIDRDTGMIELTSNLVTGYHYAYSDMSGQMAKDVFGEPETPFIAERNTKLKDISNFYDANDRFLLDGPALITIQSGDGRSVDILLNPLDTMSDLEKKFNDAIANGLGQREHLKIGAGKFVEFVRESNVVPWTSNSVEGTLVFRSQVPGKAGMLQFSSKPEELIQILGLNTIQEAKEPSFRVSVSDAHSGKTIESNVKVSGNKLLGAVHENIDVIFDGMAGIDSVWNETAKRFDLSAGANGYTTMLHIANTPTVLQTGANEKEELSLSFGDNTAKGMGLLPPPPRVTTRELAGELISKVDRAITRVSATRARLGAYQNRLEHTVSNLTVASSNLSASESRIRDLDMAKEMMNFTRLNILMQAGTSMLAQANQLPENVLQLLK